MPLLKKVTVKNFRCFRRVTTVDLEQSTYFVGINNSGKTALLSAIHCFFDSSAFSPEYLNKTELASRKGGYNRSDITVIFDLSLVTKQARKEHMTGRFGSSLKIKKSFTFREASRTVVEEYYIQGKPYTFDTLDEDVRALLRSVSISYIHPQEGQQLLEKAQEKFKERLFSNWGRHASVSKRLKGLQQQWDELRRTANSYLSTALTQSLQRMWPQSSTKVNLPEKIKDIVSVSDITFRSSLNLPEVTLTSQGTGAQSTILYQTHYILDSDRSLHRGMYFPVWLLEEPESFLHADIAVKLGKLLNSDEWLENIQMVISTHSPIILASSRQNQERTRWVVLENHAVEKQKFAKDASDEEIASIGQMLGDTNFDAYFTASTNKLLVFLEDERQLTIQRLTEAGIPVTRALKGIDNVKKYLFVFESLPEVVNGEAFFLIDNDKGQKQISQFCKADHQDKIESNFERYRVTDGVFVILMPKGFCMEDLFDEFNDVLEECCSKIYDDKLDFRDNVPLELTRAVAALRGKGRATSVAEAKALIRNENDVKDIFWNRVEQSGYQIAQSHRSALRSLMNIE
jgi:AAA15 family ATPase/GTPase